MSRAGATKVAKKDKYDALMLVVDCGQHMAEQDSEGNSAFAFAKETCDWILSRKIFTQSKDRVNIVVSGTESSNNSLEYDNITVRDEIFTTVSFDHLRYVINEIKQTPERSDVIASLIVAVDELRPQIEGDAAVEGKTILLLTNGHGGTRCSKEIAALTKAINVLGIELIVMGLDNYSNMSTPQLQSLIDAVDGTTYTFDEACQALQHFTRKDPAARAVRKMWEIAPSLRLPLALYTRTIGAKDPLKTVTVNEEGDKMQRQTVLLKRDDADLSKSFSLPDHDQKVKKDLDDEFEEKETPAIVDKSEAVFGYLFGKSKVVVTDDIIKEYNNHNFNEGEERGCLKLIQFAKRRDVNPSYNAGTSTMIAVPGWEKKTDGRDTELMKITISMIQSMLNQDVVAICRYAYHASAQVQILGLFPRTDEKGNMYMVALHLPFMDDWRPFSLPDVTTQCPVPSDEQLSVIDNLIDKMDLSKSDVQHDKILNPFFQRRCTLLKLKALNSVSLKEGHHLDDCISPSVFLKRSLEPPKEFIKDQKIFKDVNAVFGLEPVIKIKRVTPQIIAENKDFLKGEDLEEEESKPDISASQLKEGKQRKFYQKLLKALNEGASAIKSWMDRVAGTMEIFTADSTDAVEQFLILRMEMLAAGRDTEFNRWLMSLESEEYSDFFGYMESEGHRSLITNEESATSPYTVLESEMFWSGLVDCKDVKGDFKSETQELLALLA